VDNNIWMAIKEKGTDPCGDSLASIPVSLNEAD